MKRRSWLNTVCVTAVLAVTSPQAGADLPPPSKYKVRSEKSLKVRMRDGVSLASDLYLPIDAGARVGTVLIRTPYNKATYDLSRYPDSGRNAAELFAGQGFAVVVQDKRGKFESEGEYVIAKHDKNDGYDTIEWITRQPWSNGKVGTYGCSYAGELQVYLAQAMHPAHAAMVPQAAGGANGSVDGRYRYFGTRVYGAVELAATVGWHALQNASKVYLRRPSSLSREEWTRISRLFELAPRPADFDLDEVLATLPVIDMAKRAGAAPSDYADYVSRELSDPYWDQFDYLKDSSQINTPALHINSWYDFGVEDTLFQFNFFRAHAKSRTAAENQYVIISPSRHCASETELTENTVVGDAASRAGREARNVGDARFPYYEIYLRWFGYWLHGDHGALQAIPKVQYYVMGANQWRSAETWPVPGTVFTKFHLESRGRANSLYGDGILTTDAPQQTAADTFVYDPALPVRSLGGAICCTHDARDGSFDQRPNEARQDVLVYSTPPLREGVEVTGPIKLRLWVSSTARDTDFVAKLVDVYPDGRAFNIQEGILRARYREGMTRKVWMKPGEAYGLEINLNATSNFFAPGHRIRLEVASSNFPRFDRNLNTGGNNYDESRWEVAMNTVHHSPERPSHLVLPIVRTGR